MHEVAETASTNDDLAAAAAGGAPDRTVIVAGHQSAGRGRLDRTWDAPPGANLLVSVLFRAPTEDPGTLMQRMALGAVVACRQVADVDARLKWPNDLLVGERKLAGLLGQRLDDGSVVLGMGLNVRWCPPGAAMLGTDHKPGDVLAATLAAIDAQSADVTFEYRRRLLTIGRRVRVQVVGHMIEGLANDVDARGRLLVIDDAGAHHWLDAGDVVHLRDAGAER
ncbi:MAG: biotin--[acetyl-CoA-carboxylase] ligase [Actinomycetota bacterium]|nr:biotin--[acetyl-CoA-carboxylase] ligase [Actinomycetota bacterium]